MPYSDDTCDTIFKVLEQLSFSDDHPEQQGVNMGCF